MCEKNRRHYFNFPHEERRVSYYDFTSSHHTESILAANQLDLETDFVQHLAVLKENVGM